MPKKNQPAESNSFTENRVAQIRPGAVTSPEVINVFQQGVSSGADSKLRMVSFAGGPAGQAIGLSVQAWVRNLAFDKDIWLDLALVGSDGQVLHAQTLPLTYQEPAGEGGDFFALGAAIPTQVGGSVPGTALRLQYRLYGQMNGQVFTDGLLHSHEVAVEARKAAKPKAAPAPAQATTDEAPTAAAPKAAAPKAAAPKAAAPKAAAPKAAAPKAAAPKAAAPKAAAPKAAPKAAGKPVTARVPKAPKAVAPKAVASTAEARQAPAPKPATPLAEPEAPVAEIPEPTPEAMTAVRKAAPRNDLAAAEQAASTIVGKDATAAQVADAGATTPVRKPRARKS